MRTYFKLVFIATSIAFVVSCKTLSTDHLFQLQPTDATITTSVQDAMLHNEILSASSLHVETTNGIVLLSGYVKTIRQSDTAEDIARKTPGVNSVQNNIIVRK